MSQPFVGEIRMFGGNFAPAGWMLCDGALLLITDNQTLFQLIGTTYGGDGQRTFALPDLRGRLPLHLGRLDVFSRFVECLARIELLQQTGIGVESLAKLLERRFIPERGQRCLFQHVRRNLLKRMVEVFIRNRVGRNHRPGIGVERFPGGCKRAVCHGGLV